MEQKKNDVTTIIDPEAGEKTFTQEQVNAIIGERLAKEKSKADTALAEREQQFAEREKALANREAILDLKDKLNEMGLPAELLPVLNVTDTAALETALDALNAYVAKQIKENNKGFKVLEQRLEKADYGYEEPMSSQLQAAMRAPQL